MNEDYKNLRPCNFQATQTQWIIRQAKRKVPLELVCRTRRQKVASMHENFLKLVEDCTHKQIWSPEKCKFER
jgi:hypothetical protein